MKSYTIVMAVAIAFAAYCYAVPQEDNYDQLIDALIGILPVQGSQAEDYVKTLVKNTVDQELAQQSGDPNRLAQILEKGAVDTAAGADHLKSNPELYKLASEEAPDYLAAMADGVAKGYYDGEDVNNLVGYFSEKVEEATEQASS